MRSSTHVLFGAGFSGAVASWLGCGFECWILAVLGSAVLNLLVDAAGHDHRLLGGARRTRLTHSIPGVLAASLITWYLAIRGVGLPPGEEARLLASLAAGGLSHWLLDALNPGGVYVVRGRLRLARIRYDDRLANAALQAAGALLLAASGLAAAGG